MRRWFHCAPDWDTPEAEVDLRVSGNVRVVMRRPDGTKVQAQGQFRVIDRPHRGGLAWMPRRARAGTGRLSLRTRGSDGEPNIQAASRRSHPLRGNRAERGGKPSCRAPVRTERGLRCRSGPWPPSVWKPPTPGSA
ncbi:MAG: SRPBCC family protein [Solirubrobacteraceae bacterium]